MFSEVIFLSGDGNTNAKDVANFTCWTGAKVGKSILWFIGFGSIDNSYYAGFAITEKIAARQYSFVW